MKREYKKSVVTLIGIFMFIIPAKVDATLIALNGTSVSGNIKSTLSVLIPVPLISLNITESELTDFFGIAQLTITGHDEEKKYNTLQIIMGSENPIELPVPYGSFGLRYFLLPGILPPPGKAQSEIYGYLSVAHGRIVSDIKSNITLNMNVEREQIIKLLTPFLPEGIDADEVIGEGPFNVGFELNGELSDTATQDNPTISGNFGYSITLPENIFIIPLDLPDIQGNALIEVSFNWDNWNFFLPFTTVELSITLTYEEAEDIPLDPIEFDLLPRGTFIFWLDLQ